MTIPWAVTVLIVLFLISCHSQPVAPKKASPQNKAEINNSSSQTQIDTPRSFLKYYGPTDNHLFAFVGEKIFVEDLPHKRGWMDYGYKAKYAILKKVYGEFTGDTIEFVVYDHYGIPYFSRFKNVLLFVSADSGLYYHQKYLYNDVYKTKNGRWAGIYDADDYEHAYNRHTKIKPVKIEFSERIAFPTKWKTDEGFQVSRSYPEPFFKTLGDSAIPMYGNYVEELFQLKKSGYLTARGLFKPSAQQEEDMVESMQPDPPSKPPSADDLKFLRFWKIFVASINDPGHGKFRKIALDTLYVCDQLIPVNKFIDKCFNEVLDNEVRKRIADRTKLEYTFRDIEFYNLLTFQVKNEIQEIEGGFRLREMRVTRSTKNEKPPEIYFSFIETKKGFRLYEIGQSWFKECCQ